MSTLHKFKPIAKFAASGTVFLLRNPSYAWYFVSVPGPKIKAFQKAVVSGQIDLRAFGEILTSGYGNEPPAHITERMQRVYGYTGTPA